MQGAFVQLSAGAHHTCAVSEEGRLVCWGGEAGPGGSLRPPAELASRTMVQVSAGDAHACALDEDGAALCWGRNMHGEANAPKELVFSTLSCGGRNCCGITALGGQLRCWGSHAGGMLRPPQAAGTTFVALSVSSAGHACAIDAYSKLHCWGSLLGPKGGHEVWNGTFVAVAAGGVATCAVHAHGTLMCLGEVSRVWTEGAPPAGTPFSEVSMGTSAMCGIASLDAAVSCWGPRPQLAEVPEDLVVLGYAEGEGEGGDEARQELEL